MTASYLDVQAVVGLGKHQAGLLAIRAGLGGRPVWAVRRPEGVVRCPQAAS